MLRPYVRSVGNRHVRWLEPHRAALELRHFRVRIEHRIGEQVGGGLAEVERHEYLTARHALRNAGRAHHRVAARRQPYEVAVLEPELARIVGVDLDDGRSEEHTSELQSPCNLVCRLLLEKKKKKKQKNIKHIN